MEAFARTVEPPHKELAALKEEARHLKLELIKADNDLDRRYAQIEKLRRFLDALENQWWWRWLGAPVIERVNKEEYGYGEQKLRRL